MGDHRLLQIIHDEAQANGGFADGAIVQGRYGQGFREALKILVQRGYVATGAGPVGSIGLTSAGWRAAETN